MFFATILLIIALVVSLLVGLLVGLAVGVLVGLTIRIQVDKMIRKKIRKTLRPREVTVARMPPGLHPMIHESVQHRYRKITEYRPPALRGVKYVLTLDDGKVSGVKEGVLGLGAE